jgi:hypothetical protein
MNSTEYYRKNPDAAARKVAYQKKVNARPEEKKRRAELNRERRRRGIAGKGGPDVSHTTSGKTVLEDPHTNRGRQGSGGKPRLKKDVLTDWVSYDGAYAYGFHEDAAGKPCGNSFIGKTEKCTKGRGGAHNKALTAGAVGLGVGLAGVGIGLAAMSSKRGARRGLNASIEAVNVRVHNPPKPKQLMAAPGRKALPDTTPKGLLPPSKTRQSKTQRMRANTTAAIKSAEQSISQTFTEEVRRVGQIGNTMAKTGEATGMAAKTGFREIKLRAEAARRKYEPGYRVKPSRTLPEGQLRLPMPQLSPAKLREKQY